jgi:hypothetical protein
LGRIQHEDLFAHYVFVAYQKLNVQCNGLISHSFKMLLEFIVDRLRLILTNFKSIQTCPEQSGSYFICEINFALIEVHYVGPIEMHAALSFEGRK